MLSSRTAVVLSLFLASLIFQAFAYSHANYELALERRAEALEARARQLERVAAVYRRALALGLDDEVGLTERGLFGSSVKLEFKWLGVPVDWQAAVAKKIQKEFEKDKKRLGKFSKCEVKYMSRGADNMIVTGRYYNGAQYELGNPTITYNIIWK